LAYSDVLAVDTNNWFVGYQRVAPPIATVL